MSKLSTTQLTTPTSSKVLISDGSGNITTSSTTSTELGYVAGLTSAIQTQLNNKTNTADLGSNNGIATLDAGGKIPAAQLPNTVMEFKGQYNATTNSPTLVDGTGNAGDVYRVNVAGSQDFGSGTISFSVGDWVMYSGTIWEKSSNSNTVTSVNGQQGVVVLSTTDIAEGTNLYFSTERAQDATGAMATSSSKVSLTYNDGANTLTPDIVTGSLVNADINASAAIDASKLANGSVSNTEFQYLDGVTSAIQTQINSKGTGTVTSVAASVPSVLSISGSPVTTSGTLAITYSGTALPVANGGTNSTTTLNNNRVVQSSGGAIVEAAAITADRALISNANGIPTQSATTSTELGYVSGVTSAIQTQFGTKADLGANLFTGLQTMPRLRLSPQSSDPSSPATGYEYYSDGTARPAGLWYYDGTTWQPVGANAGFVATDWVDFPYLTSGGTAASPGNNLLSAITTAPSYGNSGSPVVNKAQWRRVGSEMEIRWMYRQTNATGANNGSGLYVFNLPPGYTIDTSKTPANTDTTAGGDFADAYVGVYQGGYSADGLLIGSVAVYSTTQLKVQYNALNGTGASHNPWTSASALFSNAAYEMSIIASVPISGWATNTVAAVQSVNARVHNSATTISGTLATIIWTTEDYDTDSALASGVFTVPSSGKYHVDTGLTVSGTFVLNNTSIMEIQVNGTVKAAKTQYIGGAITNESISVSTDLQLTAGDTVRVQYSNSGTTPAIVSSDTKNYFSISKIGN